MQKKYFFFSIRLFLFHLCKVLQKKAYRNKSQALHGRNGIFLLERVRAKNIYDIKTHKIPKD